MDLLTLPLCEGQALVALGLDGHRAKLLLGGIAVVDGAIRHGCWVNWLGRLWLFSFRDIDCITNPESFRIRASLPAQCIITAQVLMKDHNPILCYHIPVTDDLAMGAIWFPTRVRLLEMPAGQQLSSELALLDEIGVLTLVESLAYTIGRQIDRVIRATRRRRMLSALLSHLETYLNNGCPLQELEQWLVTHLQEILDSQDRTAIELANQVDAALVEFSAGVLDEVALRQRLDGLLRLEKTISLVLPRSFSQLINVETGTGGAAPIIEQLQVPGRVETLDLGSVAV